jgi:DNA-directed RNA polymerase subunit RPC12/RpoP
MQPFEEKLKAFNAARDLLARNDDDINRYVALELRRCLEAIVYEKLWSYRDWIPPEAARRWQPPQAFKALLAIEPDAEHSRTLFVGPQTVPGVPSSGPYKQLGVDHRPKSAWLTDTWNKLGSFLHAQWPFAASRKRSDPREFFEGVLAELDPFVHQSLTATMSDVIDFKCSQCGSLVKVSVNGVDKTRDATCLKCSARFLATKTGGSYTFFLDASHVVCEACKHTNILPSQSLKTGHRFSCTECGCKFEIDGPFWDARRINETEPSDEPGSAASKAR